MAARDEGTRSVLAARDDHALHQAFRIEVTGGPDAGMGYHPSGERTVIGTHRSADLILTDPTVSRFHCALTLGPRGIQVRDLESRNGTRIAGIDVVDGYLECPAELALGNSKLRLEPAEAPLRVPLYPGDRFGPLCGGSSAMRAAFVLLERAAASDATLLLEGETGSGKDLAASAIHAQSARSDGPLVVVDCGAVPANLLESELFGHLRGAFTGARADRAGAFEAADGGTLFLDEIGELDLELQPKLLRALESRQVKRVGANNPVAVDVRVIAATNRSLAAEVNGKRFRSDLYYRLAVLVIHLPPLRERVEDIPLLVEEILATSGARERPEAAALLDEKRLAALSRHRWPGNVRELRNYVERYLAFGEMAALEAALPESAALPVDVARPLRLERARWQEIFERTYLERLMEAHSGNVSAAARAAGVDRVHLHRLLSRAGLR